MEFRSPTFACVYFLGLSFSTIPGAVFFSGFRCWSKIFLADFVRGSSLSVTGRTKRSQSLRQIIPFSLCMNRIVLICISFIFFLFGFVRTEPQRMMKYKYFTAWCGAQTHNENTNKYCICIRSISFIMNVGENRCSMHIQPCDAHWICIIGIDEYQKSTISWISRTHTMFSPPAHRVGNWFLHTHQSNIVRNTWWVRLNWNHSFYAN